MIKYLLFAATLAACNPYLTAQSSAPPGRSARLDEVTNFWGVTKSYRIEVSQGVALAFTCAQGGPCEHLQVTSDDPKIAEIRPASLNTLERSSLTNNATSAGTVVIGHAPGITHVHVHATQGDRDIAVTVIAPPSLAVSTAWR